MQATSVKYIELQIRGEIDERRRRLLGKQKDFVVKRRKIEESI